jgi:hypothetical protein
MTYQTDKGDTMTTGMNHIVRALMAIAVVAAVPVVAHTTKAGAVSAPVLVVVGDSITAGNMIPNSWLDAWPSRVARDLIGWNVQNDAVGGQDVVSPIRGTPTIVQNFQGLISQPDVKAAIIAGGVNDLGHMANWWELPGAYAQMMTDCQNTGVSCWLATIPPQGAGWPWASATEAQREAVNEWMKVAYSDRVIDFSAVLSNSQNQLWPSYDSGDSIHPNWIGEVRMADMVPITSLLNL